MIKYKPCCDKRCGVSGCKTKEDGGCYCLCRLKDAKSTMLSLLDGTSYRWNGGIIYEPGRIKIPLDGLEKQNARKELEKIIEKIKTYEVV